jgi:hypothetical protein
MFNKTVKYSDTFSRFLKHSVKYSDTSKFKQHFYIFGADGA